MRRTLWLMLLTLTAVGCSGGVAGTDVTPATTSPEPGTSSVVVSTTATTRASISATTTTSTPLDPHEATRKLKTLVDEVERILAGIESRDRLAAIADEADTIGGSVADESGDRRFGPMMETLQVLLRAADEGTEIGPRLEAETVKGVDELVAVDLRWVTVLVAMDGTVLGHLSGYTLDDRVWAPGPIAMKDMEGQRWILDADGLHPSEGIPLAGGSMLTEAPPDGWMLETRDEKIPVGTDPALISAHRTTLTERRWETDRYVSSTAIDVETGHRFELPAECLVADQVADHWWLLCLTWDESGEYATVRSLADEVLVDGPSSSLDVPSGHWQYGEVSPDGTTLLLQWTGECEIPTAFFAPATGGDPFAYDGAEDWADTPESFAVGWTSEGDAVVLVWGSGACGPAAPHPGIFLMDGPGSGSLLYETGSAWAFARLWRPLD